LSQTHHVWGFAQGTLLSDSYDRTDSIPVSGNASALWWDEGYTEENPGTNYVSSDAGNFRVEAYDGSCWTFTGSYAYAESTYMFNPTTEYLQIHFTGAVDMHAFENEVKFSLSDETDNFVLDSEVWATEDPLSVDSIRDYVVNPSHNYELLLHAHVCIGDTPRVISNLECTIIPEPATLILLSLGAVMVRKRRA
jgi:hypothetical protein